MKSFLASVGPILFCENQVTYRFHSPTTNQQRTSLCMGIKIFYFFFNVHNQFPNIISASARDYDPRGKTRLFQRSTKSRSCLRLSTNSKRNVSKYAKLRTTNGDPKLF
eukprot:TRINITY_DN232_c0_g1_i10.p3 TRINITY_DN232_c0_g1~~TRINITY_DN232_c0_g1_i10.p3  ORF type:complete len:108 (+),score=20.14 TRINITY_DN232_c0_g1_i10:569-892(+)